MAIQGLEFDKPTLVDGGHEQKAIVRTQSGKQPVNAPTVEDIKRIAKGEAEQAAEEASATEWEKSVKNYISYSELTGDLEFSTNINMAGYSVHSCHEVTTNVIDCDYLYDNDTEENVLASNLLDGHRLFRHVITLNKSADNIAFKFSFYLSSNTDIDNIGDYLEASNMDGITGIVKDIANDLSYIGVISSDESDIVVAYNGTTVSFNDTNTIVTDDVAQC